MQINPALARLGSIVLTENIPSISIGRSVIATVLSAPKGGSVLVSMFGKRLFVETTMSLQKGQVLNLKVHAVTPKIILKPSPEEVESKSSPMRELGSMLSRIAGKFGEKPVSSFLVQEIARKLSSRGADDGPSAQFVTSVLDQIYQYPQALAYLLIPLVDGDSGSGAKVSIEKEDDAYILHFDIDTENLGNIECKACMNKGSGIDVEIKTPSLEIADFLKSGILELKESLEPFGVRSIEVVRARLSKASRKEVDVLV